MGLFDGCDIYTSLLRSHMKSIKISIKKIIFLKFIYFFVSTNFVLVVTYLNWIPPDSLSFLKRLIIVIEYQKNYIYHLKVLI